MFSSLAVEVAVPRQMLVVAVVVKSSSAQASL
jgi:hypothetical protein